MLPLSDANGKELQRLMRHAEKPHVRMKAAALWNLNRGKTRREVAEFLGVSTVSVSAWAKRFRAHGVAGLAIRPGRGRPARAQAAEVEQVLRQSPQSFGLAQTRWTLRALAQVVPSLRGFSEMGVWKVLNRMGFRYKRGQPHLTSPDPQYEEKRGGWFRPSGRPLPIQGR
jgi:putative transposase